MKKLFPTLLAFIFVTLSSMAFSANRLETHQVAAEKFFNWHFFENGRGMTISPNMSKLMWMLGEDTRENIAEEGPVTSFIEKRYGFIVRNKKLMGVFNVKYKNMEVGVLGCTACHSGKAAGVIVPGLGNKTIDPYLVGRDTYRIQRFWSSRGSDDYKYIHKKAMYFSKLTSDKKISSLTRGLVPDSTIKTFFYKDIGVPYPKDMGRAQVKVPHLWGIKQKRKAGVFNDGSLNGDNYAWIFGAELFASDSGEHLRSVLPQIKWLTDDVLGNLLPPAYPFKVNPVLADKGHVLYKRACLKCHGSHLRDQEGHPVYDTPKIIPQHIVQTDEEKLKAISPEFVSTVEKSSVSDLLTFNYDQIQKGYFAPKLWGIWSRFPYLHNGSVPNLYQLMIPANERAEIFSMYLAGEKERFDEKHGGLTLFKASDYNKNLAKAKKGDRNIYYIKREGQSNQGHYFKSFDKLTKNDKLAIIEYLKTL